MAKTSSRGNDPVSVAVIGASGFVGAAIVRALAEAPNKRPIACMRRPSSELAGLGVEMRLCDATNETALAETLADATFAVNCVMGSESTLLAATRSLCRVALRGGPRRVVHISSMDVYGAPSRGIVDETTPMRPTRTYGRAKAECEQIVHDFVSAGGDAVLLRPGCVYGPGGEQWVGRIARWLQQGRIGQMGAAACGQCNLAFSDDLAAAVLACLTVEGARGQVINVCDGEEATWNDYFLDLGRAIGAAVRSVSSLRLTVESRILAPPLQSAKILGRRFGLQPGALPEPITPSLLPLWRQAMRLDGRKADSLLGIRRTRRAVGVAASAAWYCSVANEHNGERPL
jgi:nucleoside-diphosphate-sugar epimerase